MGEVRIPETTTTVALRYRFVFKNLGDGKSILQFKPQKVKRLDPAKEITNEDELKTEAGIEDVDVEYLRSLDPKEWKKQDHYKVLGLKNLRYKASDDIIKCAYRKIVLKHHPDKRKALGEEIRPDDDYFTCITMAYETLGSLSRKRAYDSVDPEFDDSLPSSNVLSTEFFQIFSYYFELNNRWSEKQNVPVLGGPDANREDVEKFYSFWYDFKSWREYSYEDEEDKEKCTDREERRFVDKMNKAERLRKKKEEMSRIRSLVDLAYNSDPRIANFKQEDKERKLAAKRAKQSAAQARKEEEERLLKEAEILKRQAEAAEKARMEVKRQEREVQKKALKKEKKLLRDTCKSNSYYAENSEETLTNMQALDKICEMLNLLELENLNSNLRNEGKTSFLKAVQDAEELIRKEKLASLEIASSQKSSKGDKSYVPVNAEWTDDNLQLLIKAVNLFPAGTNQRWEVVSNFINQHGTFADGSSKFTARAVLSKAKDLQNTDFSKNNLKEVANKQAFDNFQKDKRNVLVVGESEISKNIDGTTNGRKEPLKKSNGDDCNSPVQNSLANGDVKNQNKPDIAWTATEQQLLEQALKTYPTSTAERWDRIAECVPNRSKKDCMKRYKELVEAVKAKKAAQATLLSK